MTVVEKSSYKLSYNSSSRHLSTMANATSRFKYISECSDDPCVYNRQKYNIREKFEEKIYDEIYHRKNIKILFYGSYLLYQELKILFLICGHVSEFHFTDYAYINFEDKYMMAFTEFMDFASPFGHNIDFYVHTNPDTLKQSVLFHNNFDIICGLDIDSYFWNVDGRIVMKNIAKNALKNGGILLVSQQYLELVNLKKFSNFYGILKLVSNEIFIRKGPYEKYQMQKIHKFLQHFLLLNVIKILRMLRNVIFNMFIRTTHDFSALIK